MTKLTGIVITKNEQDALPDCLKSLEFVDEVIVVDTGNTDRTNQVAIAHQARIVKSSGRDYSQFRNAGLKAAKGDWILYVDADERVTPLLRGEIEQIISSNAMHSAFAIRRRNFYLGREMSGGGWGNDKVIRLFKKSSLQGYTGQLHEQPVFTGSLGTLTRELTHFSHRDLSSMLDKTLVFTEYEARLRHQVGHPPVVWWRMIRVMVTEFWHRFVRLCAWRDGVEGVIDGTFQVFNMFVIYARLWEMQQRKS